jgi:hypothetical protein
MMAILALTLTSCEPPEIKIRVTSVRGRQVVTLWQDWGLIFSRKKAPCVDRIDLNSSAGDRPLVWRLEAKSKQCVDLGQFAIGEVPAGFVERVPLRAQPKGWFDFLVVGAGMGEAQFRLGQS